MAKDRKKLQHIHSSVPDKQPTPSTLEIGEIAVNNAKDQEFLSIKNSDDKVVRISSDEQIVTIMEKKAVIPYSGTVDNVHLDTNKSNIEIKLNQVVADNTAFHNVVNGSKDIDGNLVNPTTDGGLTNGAGFAIDMSKYALIGANPSFSSVTTDCKTTLNGSTSILGSTGTCGSRLDIDVATETGNIGSATNTIGTNSTTVSGNSTLVVSGTTTETHVGDVTETNKGDYVINVSGDTYLTSNSEINLEASKIVGLATGQTVHFYGKESVLLESWENGITDEVSQLILNGNGTASLNSTDTLTISSTRANTCVKAKLDADLYGEANTKVGVSCDGSVTSKATIQGNEVIMSGTTINENASTINISGTTKNENFVNYDINASNNYCVSASSKANFYGTTTNIGVDCNGQTTATTINISGATINEGGTTNNNNFDTINNNVTNYNITGTTVISGECTIGDTLVIKNGLEKNLSWTYGNVKVESGNSTNFKSDASFVIPQCVDDINRAKLQITYGSTSDKSGDVTYDPGDNCTNTVSKTINIPTCVSHLNRATLGYSYGTVTGKSSSDNGTYDPGDNCTNTNSDSIVIPTCLAELKNWNGSCYSLDSDVCVTGDVTATGSFYSTSDERKKENIKPIDYDTKLKARNVHLKSFNYIEDESKRTIYGVIAQDVEAAGLNELVHIDEQGIKAVDYTSFLILRISYLERLIGQMNSKIVKLEEEINKNK